MSIARGVIDNGLANVVQKVVRVLDQLLLVPFFLTAWGAAYYGEWLTLSIIPSVLAFSDLGFGSAVSNGFVLAYASGDRQSAANIARSGLWVITGSVLLGALLTAAVMVVGSRMGLFDKSLIDARDATLAVLFMMVAKLLSFYNQIVEGYFRAVRRAALGTLLGSGSHVAGIVVGIAVLYAGSGVVGYALTHLLVTVAYMVVYYAIGLRQIDFSDIRSRVVRSDVRMIVTKGMGYMMSPIWQSIYFQGGTFVVRLVLGPEAVALFNTVRTACRSVTQIFSTIYGSVFPDMQYEYGRGNMTSARRLFRIAAVFSFVVALVGTGALMLFGQWLYGLWTRSTLTVPTLVWDLFMVGILLNATWWTASSIYRVVNKPFHFAIASTSTAVFSVGLSYVLALGFGLTGAVVGTVVFDAIMAVYVLPDSCRLLGMYPRDIVRHISSDGAFLCGKLRSMYRLHIKK